MPQVVVGVVRRGEGVAGQGAGSGSGRGSLQYNFQFRGEQRAVAEDLSGLGGVFGHDQVGDGAGRQFAGQLQHLRAQRGQ